MPKGFLKKDIKTSDLLKIIKKQLPFILIIVGVVAFHLIEVRFIDSDVTKWVGVDYANNIRDIEGDLVYSFSQNWIPGILHFFVLIYIAVYPFTLWFSPLYFIVSDKKESMKALAYGLLIIYAVSLPFYLFVPVTNVYTYYNVNSALETVIPSIENFFYTTTTHNNCLPSLHTAMTILIAYSVSLTNNKKLTYFTYFVMICVIISVIYLSIHWLTDVLTGIALSLATIFLLKRYILK
jgi:membrane-associated phospholipid phosphatase